MAPSHNLTAVETSLEKSTCPGESMRLTIKSSFEPRKSLNKSDMQLLFIVIPRSCSSGRLSMYLNWPAIRCEIIPISKHCEINDKHK